MDKVQPKMDEVQVKMDASQVNLDEAQVDEAQMSIYGAHVNMDRAQVEIWIKHRWMYLELVNRDREQMNMDEAQMSTDELQDNIGWSTRDYMNRWHVIMDEARVVEPWMVFKQTN